MKLKLFAQVISSFSIVVVRHLQKIEVPFVLSLNWLKLKI